MLKELEKFLPSRKRPTESKPKSIKRMVIGSYISIINLNVNGLNAPAKRYRLTEWIQKQDPYIYAAYKRPTSDLETHTD